MLKAVSKNPADRYATAREFADDLQRFLDNRPILARRPTLSQRRRKWARRHPAVIAACVVVLVLMAFGSLAGALLLGEEQAETQAAYDRVREEQHKTQAAYDRVREEQAKTQATFDRIREEQHKTQAAYDGARQRADEAEKRFHLARKSVDEMIELSEALVDQRSMEGLRKRLLESALGILPGVHRGTRHRPRRPGGPGRPRRSTCAKSWTTWRRSRAQASSATSRTRPCLPTCA